MTEEITKEKSKNDFTEGKILPRMLRFSVPILGALLLQAMYGAADLMIVGQFGDVTGVSAVGTGSAIMQLVTVIITGLTMGTTVILGQYLGEGKPEEAGKTVGASVVLFTIVAAVLTIFMFLFVKPLANLLQAPEEAFDKTVQYVLICSAGIIFITAYNVISGIFRGLGNSKLPMIFVLISCLVNIAGDLLLVGMFHLDAAGAAIATITAQAVSVVMSFFIMRRTKLPFSFSKKYIRFYPDKMKRIVTIGTPIAFQDALVNLSFLLINSTINGIGLNESAGYGVSQRVTAFIFLVPSAVMQGVSVFVAQNVGAGKKDRAKQAMYTAMTAGCFAGIFLFMAGFFFGDILSAAFSKDAAVIEQSAAYLKGFSADCLLTCILFSFTGYFNGNGRTLFVMIQGITSSFLVRFPVSWLMSITEGTNLTRIGLAAPIATIYGIIFYMICYIIMRRQEKKSEVKSAV